jgi:lysophospholipase L1-like esterase
MKAIIEHFKGYISRTAAPSRIVLALVPPIPEATPFPFSAESTRRVREEINPAIAGLAREFGLPLVDNYRIFEERPDLLPAVHPTIEGFRLLARNWLEAVGKILKERK